MRPSYLYNGIPILIQWNIVLHCIPRKIEIVCMGCELSLKLISHFGWRLLVDKILCATISNNKSDDINTSTLYLLMVSAPFFQHLQTQWWPNSRSMYTYTYVYAYAYAYTYTYTYTYTYAGTVLWILKIYCTHPLWSSMHFQFIPPWAQSYCYWWLPP